MQIGETLHGLQLAMPTFAGRPKRNTKCLAVLLIAIILLWSFTIPIHHLLLRLKDYVTATSTVVTSSVVTSSRRLARPSLIHLSLGDRPSDMVVVWSLASFPYQTVVSHGGRNNSLDSVTKGTCAKQGDDYTGRLHVVCRAKMTGLRPGVVVYYNIEVFHTRTSKRYHSFSDVYSFRTFKADGGRDVLVYGDLGTASKSFHSIVREGRERNYSAVLHVGDIAYDLGLNGGRVGDDFLRELEPLAARVPYMTTPGDHERFDSFSQYRLRFSMPGSRWPTPVDKLWYSYPVGAAYVVSVSTEVFFGVKEHATTQGAWLREVLAWARTRYPWLVVAAHRPLYCAMTEPDDCAEKESLVRTGFEELFVEYGVDLVVQGHAHSYMRTWPMYKGVQMQKNYTNPRWPTYVIVGMTGSSYMVDPVYKASNLPWAVVSVTSDTRESFGRISVVNGTHLKWNAVFFNNHEILDEFWITKDSRTSEKNSFWRSQESFPMEVNKKHDGSLYVLMLYFVCLNLLGLILVVLVRRCRDAKHSGEIRSSMPTTLPGA